MRSVLPILCIATLSASVAEAQASLQTRTLSPVVATASVPGGNLEIRSIPAGRTLERGEVISATSTDLTGTQTAFADARIFEDAGGGTTIYLRTSVENAVEPSVASIGTFDVLIEAQFEMPLFADITISSEAVRSGNTTSFAAFDIDNDGTIDGTGSEGALQTQSFPLADLATSARVRIQCGAASLPGSAQSDLRIRVDITPRSAWSSEQVLPGCSPFRLEARPAFDGSLGFRMAHLPTSMPFLVLGTQLDPIPVAVSIALVPCLLGPTTEIILPLPPQSIALGGVTILPPLDVPPGTLGYAQGVALDFTSGRIDLSQTLQLTRR